MFHRRDAMWINRIHESNGRSLNAVFHCDFQSPTLSQALTHADSKMLETVGSFSALLQYVYCLYTQAIWTLVDTLGPIPAHLARCVGNTGLWLGVTYRSPMP